MSIIAVKIPTETLTLHHTGDVGEFPAYSVLLDGAMIGVLEPALVGHTGERHLNGYHICLGSNEKNTSGPINDTLTPYSSLEAAGLAVLAAWAEHKDKHGQPSMLSA